jgi:hypothetical protein
MSRAWPTTTLAIDAGRQDERAVQHHGDGLAVDVDGDGLGGQHD